MKSCANSIRYSDISQKKQSNFLKSSYTQSMNLLLHSRNGTPRGSFRRSLKMGSMIQQSFKINKNAKVRSNPNSLQKNSAKYFERIQRKKMNKENHKNDNHLQIHEYNLKKQFIFVYQIGFGGFGKVWKIQQKATWKCFAMKEIQKRKVIEKESIQCILNQKKILSTLHHPFIVNMTQAFQDESNLYLVIDYLKGADLRYHICYKQTFSQAETKFLLACLIVAIQYIHKNGIIHRDIKPENLIMEEKGYLRVTDFGIAKYYKEIITKDYDSSGTPGYMAPEILLKQQYTFSADFFAIGVIGYELMLGKRPYQGKNRKQIKQIMLSQDKKIKKDQLLPGWSQNSMKFINSLIEKDPLKRLGNNNGIKQLKKHPWFSEIQWRKLQRKQIYPPFVPYVVCQTKQYLDQISCYNEISESEQKQNEKPQLSRKQQEMFAQYYFEKIKKLQPKRKDQKARKNNQKVLTNYPRINNI